MPSSIKSLESILEKDFLENYSYKQLTVIDVWAGTWQKSDLLKKYTWKMIWVEVFKPYIEQNLLEEKYDTIINEDIMDIYDKLEWDIRIFGDVLEHLSVEDAQEIINYLKDKWVIIYIQIPRMYPQWIEFWNKYEIHLQPDITKEVFNERYPWFELLWEDSEIGLYKFTT